jgi:hypothetical protein
MSRADDERVTMEYLSTQIHAVNPPAYCALRKELTAEVFSLRRNHTFWPLQ